jgi:hypothetical protein
MIRLQNPLNVHLAVFLVCARIFRTWVCVQILVNMIVSADVIQLSLFFISSMNLMMEMGVKCGE